MLPTLVTANPIRPRFITLTGGDGGIATWQRQTFFKFPYDTVVHWVAIDSTMRLVAGGVSTEAGIALNMLGEQTTFPPGTTPTNLLWKSGGVMAAAGVEATISKQLYLDCQNLFVPGNTTWAAFLIARGSSYVTFDFNIAYSYAPQYSGQPK